MLHVSVTYRGLRAVGMVLDDVRFAQGVAFRAAGKRGAVHALDAHGRHTVIVVHDLGADPEVLGVGVDATSVATLEGAPTPDHDRP